MPFWTFISSFLVLTVSGHVANLAHLATFWPIWPIFDWLLFLVVAFFLVFSGGTKMGKFPFFFVYVIFRFQFSRFFSKLFHMEIALLPPGNYQQTVSVWGNHPPGNCPLPSAYSPVLRGQICLMSNLSPPFFNLLTCPDDFPQILVFFLFQRFHFPSLKNCEWHLRSLIINMW